MSTAPYRVVLTGRTMRGKTVVEVAAALGPLMGLDAALAATLLRGGATAVKSDLSHEAARHYVAAFNAVGADARCEIEDAVLPARSSAATPMSAQGVAEPALDPLVVAPGVVSVPARSATVTVPDGAGGGWVWAIVGTTVAVVWLGLVPGVVALLVYLCLRPVLLRQRAAAGGSPRWAGLAAVLAGLVAATALAALLRA